MKRLLRKIPPFRWADDWTDRLNAEGKMIALTLMFITGVLLWLALIYVVTV